MLIFFEAPGGGKSLSLIQMILLTHLKAGFEKKGLTVVANLATDDGLTALLLNAGASAQPTKVPLHVIRVTPEISLVRR